MKSILIVLFLTPFIAHAAGVFNPENNPASVTLPMEQYLDLRKQVEGEPLTTIEEITLRGQFGKELSLQLRGRYVGRAETVVFLKGAGLDPVACQGEALLKRAGQTLSVLPTNKNFKLDCRLRIKDWNDVNFTIESSLNFNAQITGGDTEVSETEGGYNVRLLKLERQIAQAPVLNEAPSTIARYQIVVAPEETSFAYYLYFNNPNRDMREIAFTKTNHEVIQKVATSLSYSDKNNQLLFKLPPGESQVRLTGRLPEPEFRSPMKQAREYLLVENDPLVSVEVTGGNKRISVPDTGLRPRFSGAKAFLLTENDKLTWTANSIEVFPALTYTIETANYEVYWSPEQNSLAEANFYINNQGVSEIPLKIPGEARYAEVNGTPQVLIKNKSGDLVVRVPYGNGQTVMVQFQPVINTSRGLASIHTALPKPTTMMSQVHVALKTPANKSLMFASGLGDRQWPVSMGQILFSLVTFLLIYIFGREMQLRLPFNLAISTICAFLNAVNYLPLILVLCVLAIALLLHHRGRLLGGWQTSSRFAKIGMSALALITLIWLGFGRPLSSIQMATHVMNDLSGMERVSEPMMKGAVSGFARTRGAVGKAASINFPQAPPAAPMAQNAMEMDRVDSSENEGGSAATTSYQGLPAKISVPAAQTVAQFSLTLANPEQTLALNAIALPAMVLQFILAIGLLLLAILIWQERNRLRSFVRL